MIVCCNNKECVLRDKCLRGKTKPMPDQEVKTFEPELVTQPISGKQYWVCNFQKPCK